MASEQSENMDVDDTDYKTTESEEHSNAKDSATKNDSLGRSIIIKNQIEKDTERDIVDTQNLQPENMDVDVTKYTTSDTLEDSNTKDSKIIDESLDSHTVIQNMPEKDKTINTDDLSDIPHLLSDNIIEEAVVVSQEQADFTNKFLNGELTFSEYTHLMEGNSRDAVDAVEFDESVENPDMSVPQSSSDNLMKKSDKSPHVDWRRTRRILPPTLEGLMGEANVRSARGDKDTAIKMCFEIIRQVPTAPEPFECLSYIYEELSCPDKALQCSLIAAYLRPRDVDKWVHLADMSEKQGDIKQAVTCYSKAISADPQNIELYVKRGSLLEVTGDKKAALKGYMRLLEVISCNEGNMQEVLDIARMVAQKFYEEDEIQKAREALEIAFRKCSPVVTLEESNLMLELLTSLKEYKRCLEILIEFCNVQIEIETTIDDSCDIDLSELKITSCKVPNDLVVDIYVKLIVVLIHLHAFDLVDSFSSIILAEQDPEETGDLFLDVAEALMSEGKHEKALLFLSPLVNSKNYSLAAVWLRQAECFRNCGNFEDAVHSYKMVINQAPQHLDARIILSGLLKDLGDYEDAINVLEQNAETDILDPRLLYERCILLKKSNRIEEFLVVGQLLLSRHCVHIRHAEEIFALARQRRFDKKREALKEIRALTGEIGNDARTPSFAERHNAPSVAEEYQLLRELCEACFQLGNLPLFQRLSFSALGSKKFHSDLSKIQEIEFLCLLSSVYNNDNFTAYNMVHDMVLRDQSLNRLWNLLNIIIQRSDDGRHNRFIMRLLFKNQNSKPLSILHANNCLVSGTYKYALNEYVSAFIRHPDALLAFLVSITFFQMSCQKFSSKRHALVTQGLSFMSLYQKKRGEEGQQESYYNFGRIYHQLGLYPAAINFYNLALDSPAPEGACYDLKREIAFNLHLIYMKSGTRDLARSYIDKYIKV